MDKLKQYLQERRAELDVDTPPERVSADILRPAVERSLRLPLRYAAAVLIIAAGAGVWSMLSRDEAPQLTADRPQISEPSRKDSVPGLLPLRAESTGRPSRAIPRARTADVPEEVAEVDRSFEKLINSRLELLRSTPVYAESPEYFSAFMTQLHQMDKDEQLLKTDLTRYGLNDQLLQSLIDIYQQKLNLLRTLQQEINQMNQVVPKTDPYYLNL